ncbi:hypothetical protein ACFQWB_11665 [Paenibacillus thermoaerophilus]|uniref:WYL domain-containing protein n=1 Tax=Paenibacillus thermoaerophilus TaxID=1215385 RepID=A0ABW2V5K5_9BACL|nr:hypothetical protein [Paenibacillus thermoaerophilus]TMV11076.1 hypothetical protein FE781_12965 [Paenibacillus thermoaerophilus]
MPLKYVGHAVTIIYVDRKGAITQRSIRVQAVRDGKVKAYDITRGAPRLFAEERILAVRPMAS